jgi:hypothetical protein
MRGSIPLSRSNPVAFLVTSKFPEYSTALATKREPTGHSAIDDKAQRVVDEASSYAAELSKLTPEQIGVRVKAAQEDEARRLQEHRDAEERARPFNQPYAQADFQYWAQMSYWSPDEGVALSFGKNPAVASWETLKTLTWKSSFASFYASRRLVVTRAVEMGQLWQKTSPSVFLAWAERMKFEMPQDLKDATDALGVQIGDWKTLYGNSQSLLEKARTEASDLRSARMEDFKDRSKAFAELRETHDRVLAAAERLSATKDQVIAQRDEIIAEQRSTIEALQIGAAGAVTKPLGTRERDSLLKLVVGLAIGGYGYNPRAARNASVKEIAGDLDRHGVPLDEDTIRKYLTEGKEMLPAA